MKKILANLVIALGAVIAFVGIAGTPLVQDQLPIVFKLPDDGQATHRFFRVVPAEPQGPDFLPYVLIPLGLTILVVGIAFRRKLRSIAA